MKMAELSRTTGVPVPTIKYYLREGLLLPGVRTSRNQAEYDQSHVRRLNVIRSLAEVAQLPLSTISEILRQVDSPEPKLHASFGLAQRSVTADLTSIDDSHRDTATAMLQDVVTDRDWHIDSDTPAYHAAVSVLATFLALGAGDLADGLPHYASAAEIIGASDVERIVQRAGDPGRQIEGVVIGTLLGDQLIAALRRLAQENASRRAFGGPPQS